MPRKITLAPSGCVCRNPQCLVPYGYCHCGCGEKSKLAPRSNTSIGWVVGFPTKFLWGHAHRSERIDFSDTQPFKIDGTYCKLLSLTNGIFAIIDAADYYMLSRMSWFARKTKDGHFYAGTGIRIRPGKNGTTTYSLQQFLLGLPMGSKSQGDHRNGVTLDYRRKNLRIVNKFQNGQNHGGHRTNTSGRTGVSWDKRAQAYHVAIRINGKQKNLGNSKSFEDACRVREEAEKKYHGEFARAQ
jgi:hypothetical protein